MYTVKQSAALTVPVFVHDANGDAVTGLVDGGFTKRISKASGAFAAMMVTITEMENGWYSVPLSTSHTDTLGLLSITLTHGSSKQVNLQFRVEANLVDTVKADTAAILLDTGTDGVAISTAQAQAIADEILKRDMSVVTGEAARSMLNALRFLRNKWTITGTTLSVKEEDDLTEAWNATLTTTAGADPVTSSDPA